MQSPKGVPFVTRRYTKGVPFLPKMVYSGVRGWAPPPPPEELSPAMIATTGGFYPRWQTFHMQFPVSAEDLSACDRHCSMLHVRKRNLWYPGYRVSGSCQVPNLFWKIYGNLKKSVFEIPVCHQKSPRKSPKLK